MLGISVLNWIGSAAIGLVWGWLCGLLSAPPKQTITAVVPPSSKLVTRWLRWWNSHETLRLVARVFMWLLILAAPTIGVFKVMGYEPMLLFVGTAGLAWWLHYAWREQLESNSLRGKERGE